MNKVDEQHLKYLELLSQTYTNVNQASTEIINLQAILSLPKGTEHFVSDIHGEFDSFNHVLKNASGVIKNYIEELFGTALMEKEKRNLAMLIYYPEKMIEKTKSKESNIDEWYKIYLFRLVQICKRVASKYTKSKVRKSLPSDFAYILEEIIHESADTQHKHAYYNEIVDSIISLGRASNFIIAISNVIQRLAVDHLHVIGDIYDRGSGAVKIMDMFIKYHSIDVQWGNHDISWMGAAAGSAACICNVIRVCAKYYNLDTIEEDYGINLVPLATFAMDTYTNLPHKNFMPNNYEQLKLNDKEIDLISKMHKAITIIQLKVEAAVIKQRPEYFMNDRLLFHKINFENKTVDCDGHIYNLIDDEFPTINKEDPYKLTDDETDVLEKIIYSFKNSEKLQQHARFLFNKGGMYKIFNSKLLFHGCIPLNEDGTFREVTIDGKPYSGRSLLDAIEARIRRGYYAKENTSQRKNAQDLMWYLWCGEDSPLFGKNKMSTFERYFVKEKEAQKEKSDAYYALRDNEEVCKNILKEFMLDENNAHIVNGHVPVKVSKGENPVKANGRLIVIDGGFAKAYQKVTGIAGYTLISNSQGLLLASHEPFESSENAIAKEIDIVTNTNYIERYPVRRKVLDTDVGNDIKARIDDLKALLVAYSDGYIKEK